jgi:S1-C subfamily serine protease
MQDPYVDTQNSMPYQPVSMPDQDPYQPTLPQRAPGQFQTDPNLPPVNPRRSGSRVRTGAIIALTLVLALVFGVGLFAGWQFGRGGTSTVTGSSSTGTLQTGAAPAVTVPPLSGNNIDTVREAVIAKVRPSVVEVNVSIPGGSGIGSGVIVDRRGYIVTNNHVVSNAQSIQVVLYNGTKLQAQLVGTDPADDLAVLKITPPSSGLTVATLGDSSKLQVGQDVMAIGNPLGITQTVTSGIVSALGRSVSEGQGGATIPNAIQTDAPINPGNSGGALVDLQGNLVGIPTLTAIDPEFNTPANGVGFAIPSNRVAFIVPQIIANGSVTHTGRAYLGVNLTSVDATLAAQDNLAVDHGALVVNVVSGSPAASAGLRSGDVIVQIGNSQVNDVQSLSDILVNSSPGQRIALKVYRGSQQLTVNVTLGELPSGG